MAQLIGLARSGEGDACNLFVPDACQSFCSVASTSMVTCCTPSNPSALPSSTSKPTLVQWKVGAHDFHLSISSDCIPQNGFSPQLGGMGPQSRGQWVPKLLKMTRRHIADTLWTAAYVSHHVQPKIRLSRTMANAL